MTHHKEVMALLNEKPPASLPNLNEQFMYLQLRSETPSLVLMDSRTYKEYMQFFKPKDKLIIFGIPVKLSHKLPVPVLVWGENKKGLGTWLNLTSP